MTSDPNELERKALDLVEQALSEAAGDEKSFIQDRARNDAELQKRALSILSANDADDAFLVTGGAVDFLADDPLPGKIGAYQVERKLGGGGMGVVYLGRHQTADFDHVAAIKVVRTDAVSSRLIERLRSERRTLAKLKHPNIAQLYDGGETENGEPYVVMEYVPGAPIDDYLAKNNLNLEERLRLFHQICNAVSFAHRNLIIHRDLTPANILVTDEGQVKLIDFGISYSLRDEENSKRADIPRRTMTKGYAAPEREQGVVESTITDVFSLGVVLQDLIEGVNAPRRHDLDAIVRKARAEAPEDRYQSVDALIQDVMSYSRGDVVSAVNGGWTYSLARFVARRKLAVGAGMLAAITAVLTAVVMSVLYLKAEAAEQRSAERFDEVRELASFIMFDFHDEVAKLDGSTPVRELLTKTALDYLDALSSSPNVSTELKLEIAQGYKRLSDVTGNPTLNNLGRREQAAELLGRARVLMNELKLQGGDDVEILRAEAEILFAGALITGFSENDREQSVELGLAAQKIYRLLIEGGNASVDDKISDAYINITNGYIMEAEKEGEAAVSMLLEGIRKYEALVAEYPEHSGARFGLARGHVTLAEKMAWREYYKNGEQADYEATLPYFESGIDTIRSLMSEGNSTPLSRSYLIIALLKRANTTCYMTQERAQEGLADLKEAETRLNSWIEKDPENNRLYVHLTHVTAQMVECFYNLGQLEEGYRAAEQAIQQREAQLREQPHNPDLLSNLINTVSVVSRFQTATGDEEAGCASGVRLQELIEEYERVVEVELQAVLNERKANKGFLESCAEKGFTGRAASEN